MFLLNILFALAWATLTGQFTVINLLFGFGLGYLLLWLVPAEPQSTSYFYKVYRLGAFIVFFLVELVIANLRVALNVLFLHRGLRPGIIAVPLSVRTDKEITLLMTLITLTPGTLSLDVSHDRQVLYIHAIHIDDPETLRSTIKQGFERRVQELFS